MEQKHIEAVRSSWAVIAENKEKFGVFVYNQYDRPVHLFSLSSSWYNRTGWLGVKHQLTLSLSLVVLAYFTVLENFSVILFPRFFRLS